MSEFALELDLRHQLELGRGPGLCLGLKLSISFSIPPELQPRAGHKFVLEFCLGLDFGMRLSSAFACTFSVMHVLEVCRCLHLYLRLNL